MEPFHRLEAVACALPLSGIDTDQLIPARFMSRPRAEGYGGLLLHDLRFDARGEPVADFPLNDPASRDARILVARRNFGGGSSREAAVYALVDYGIRCVLAPSFGDIFAGNAANNGLLTARMEEGDVERLIALIQAGSPRVTVDLEARRVSAAAFEADFAVDPVVRTKLLHGWDDLDLTRAHRDDVGRFCDEDRVRRPWAAPRPV